MDANAINYPKKSNNTAMSSDENSKNCLSKGQGKVYANKEIRDVLDSNGIRLMNTRIERMESALENITIRINKLSNTI